MTFSSVIKSPSCTSIIWLIWFPTYEYSDLFKYSSYSFTKKKKSVKCFKNTDSFIHPCHQSINGKSRLVRYQGQLKPWLKLSWNYYILDMTQNSNRNSPGYRSASLLWAAHLILPAFSARRSVTWHPWSPCWTSFYWPGGSSFHYGNKTNESTSAGWPAWFHSKILI